MSNIAMYEYNFTVRAVHISGKNNIKADLISRFQLTRFQMMFPDRDSQPVMVTESVKNSIRL